ncbi:MAG: alkaline phosphatase [Bryobacteraceae bacterium]
MKRTFLGAVLAATSLISAAFAGDARHIILFIGDGMQLATEMGTSRYLFGGDTQLSFHKLPYKGSVATWDVTAYNINAAARGKPGYDAGAIVPSTGYDPTRGGYFPWPMQQKGVDAAYLTGAATDSASAATAWATGYKTDNGNLAWLPGDPPGGALRTVADILRSERGFSIGVASTVPFSHATPAAHVSHNVNRNNYHAIANEIVMAVQPDVVIGGGYHSKTYMSPAALSFLASNPSSPYVFVQRQTGVDGGMSLRQAANRAVAQRRKLFGLYGDPETGNFESPVPLDRPSRPQVDRGSIENPLLRDAVVAALDVLKRNPKGFFVMFEQGDIDWAAHANDYRRMVGTTWDLHEAVRAAIDYVNRSGDDITWGNTLLLVTADHANSCLRLDKPLPRGDLPAQSGTSYPDGEISFGSKNHTNELVRLYAMGAGSDRIKRREGDWYPCTTILDNTQLFHIMLEAAGLPKPSPLKVRPDKSACR